MIRPPDVNRGDDVKAEHMQQVAKSIRELQNRLPAKPRKGGARAGATLCPLSRVSTDSDDNTLAWINEGAIHAAGEHADVGGDGTTFTITANHNIWAQVTITAEVLENTLTGNWTAENLILGSGAPPTDHVWTPDAEVGVAYAPLGYWDADKKWHAYGCGSVTFLFCAQSTQQGYARFFRG